MFELFFGFIWTVITAIITVALYAAEEVTVNETVVSQGEFLSMLWPKLFLAFFWIIWLFMLFRGIRKIIKNAATDMKGEECFGKVCNIYESVSYVNDVPELKADILVYIPSLYET